MEILLNPGAWLAFLTLAFLEIVLGVDNIVFLSIVSSKLPAKEQPRARKYGLLLAMLFRIILLFCISLLMQLSRPFFLFHVGWLHAAVSGQSLIILVGGLFLLYKSVMEIHEKLEGGHIGTDTLPDGDGVPCRHGRFWSVIAQIVALDMVFSLDSVLTAVGMVSFSEFGYGGAMAVMIAAIVCAVLIMLLFSAPVSRFVNEHPTIQMLGLSFLILIGVMLLVEAAHLSHLNVFGSEVGEIPKGYIYFAIAFSLLVEVLNMRLRKKHH
jgi:predicted tellurium resistance membrane protein TerC